jgi:hypothetical protein
MAAEWGVMWLAKLSTPLEQRPGTGGKAFLQRIFLKAELNPLPAADTQTQ